MPVNWIRRGRQWYTVLRRESQRASWPKMARALLTGPVPRTVWRRRIRICLSCPVYDPRFKACRPADPQYAHLGCGCFTPFTALFAAPYKNGCWGRQMMADVGWPSYLHIGYLAKSRAILRFLLGK